MDNANGPKLQTQISDDIAKLSLKPITSKHDYSSNDTVIVQVPKHGSSVGKSYPCFQLASVDNSKQDFSEWPSSRILNQLSSRYCHINEGVMRRPPDVPIIANYAVPPPIVLPSRLPSPALLPTPAMPPLYDKFTIQKMNPDTNTYYQDYNSTPMLAKHRGFKLQTTTRMKYANSQKMVAHETPFETRTDYGPNFDREYNQNFDSVPDYSTAQFPMHRQNSFPGNSLYEHSQHQKHNNQTVKPFKNNKRFFRNRTFRGSNDKNRIRRRRNRRGPPTGTYNKLQDDLKSSID